jgi:hypothetical protein
MDFVLPYISSETALIKQDTDFGLTSINTALEYEAQKAEFEAKFWKDEGFYETKFKFTTLEKQINDGWSFFEEAFMRTRSAVDDVVSRARRLHAGTVKSMNLFREQYAADTDKLMDSLRSSIWDVEDSFKTLQQNTVLELAVIDEQIFGFMKMSRQQDSAYRKNNMVRVDDATSSEDKLSGVALGLAKQTDDETSRSKASAADALVDLTNKLEKPFEDVDDFHKDLRDMYAKEAHVINERLIAKGNEFEMQSNGNLATFASDWRTATEEPRVKLAKIEARVAGFLKTHSDYILRTYQAMDKQIESVATQLDRVYKSGDDADDGTKEMAARFEEERNQFERYMAVVADRLHPDGADFELLMKNLEMGRLTLAEKGRTAVVARVDMLEQQLQTGLAKAEEEATKKMLYEQNETDAIYAKMKAFIKEDKYRIRWLRKSIFQLEKFEKEVNLQPDKIRNGIDAITKATEMTAGKQDFDFERELIDDERDVERSSDVIRGTGRKIAEDTARSIKRMPNLLTEGQDMLVPVRDEHDADVADFQAILKDHKKQFGMWVHHNLNVLQKRVDKTGKLVDEILPAMKLFIQHRSSSVLLGLVKMRKRLEGGLKKIDRVLSVATPATFQNEAKVAADEIVKPTLEAYGKRVQMDLNKAVERTADDAAPVKATAEKLRIAAQASKSQMAEMAKVVKKENGMVMAKFAELEKPEDLVDSTFTNLLSETREAVDADVGAAEHKGDQAIKAGHNHARDTMTSDLATFNAATSETENDVQKEAMKYELGTAKTTRHELKAVEKFLAHARGEAENQTEWLEHLSQGLDGEVAQARFQTMLSQKNMLERQAAVESHFNDLRDIVKQQASGLDAQTQGVMDELVLAAKESSRRIVADVTLTRKEKLVELRKVTNWLESELVDITSELHSEDGLLSGVEHMDDNVQQDAEDRLARLDAKLNLPPPTQELTAHEPESISRILESLAAQVDAIATRHATRNQEIAVDDTDRTAASFKETRQKIRHLHTMLDASVDAEESVLKKGNQAIVKQQKDAADMADDIEAFMTTSQLAASKLSDWLGRLMTDRGTKMDAVKSWQTNVFTRGAETLERLMQVVLIMLQSSTKTFEMDRSEQTKFGDDLASVVESTGFQRLRKIKKADETVDRVLEKNKELLNWTAQHDNETVRWRAEVVSSLQNLTQSADAEFQRQQAEASNWQHNLHAEEVKARLQAQRVARSIEAQEQRQRDKAAARVQEQIAAAKQEFENEEASDLEEKKQLEFETASNLKEAVEAQKEMEHARDALLKFSVSAGNDTAAGDAVRHILHILDTKQEEVDAAQHKVQDRIQHLKYVTYGKAMSSLIEGARPIEAVEGSPWSWPDGAALLQEHERLAARARELAVKLEHLPRTPDDHGSTPVLPIPAPPSSTQQL